MNKQVENMEYTVGGLIKITEKDYRVFHARKPLTRQFETLERDVAKAIKAAPVCMVVYDAVIGLQKRDRTRFVEPERVGIDIYGNVYVYAWNAEVDDLIETVLRRIHEDLGVYWEMRPSDNSQSITFTAHTPDGVDIKVYLMDVHGCRWEQVGVERVRTVIDQPTYKMVCTE